MPSKLSAKERQQWIDAIAEDAARWSGSHGIRFPLSDDPADVAAAAAQHRERLKLQSDDEVLFEAYERRLQRIDVIGPEQSYKAAARTERIKSNLLELLDSHAFRQLLHDYPDQAERRAYRLLRLHAQHKGAPPRMERAQFHELFVAVIPPGKKRDK